MFPLLMAWPTEYVANSGGTFFAASINTKTFTNCQLNVVQVSRGSFLLFRPHHNFLLHRQHLGEFCSVIFWRPRATRIAVGHPSPSRYLPNKNQSLTSLALRVFCYSLYILSAVYLTNPFLPKRHLNENTYF